MVRKKTLVLITVLVTFSIFGLWSNQMTNLNEQARQEINPQASQLTELPHVVRIDDNWTETVVVYDWCTGSGTELDPYVIQGVNISIRDQGPSVFIKDSTENFVIKNCSFSNVAVRTLDTIYYFRQYAGILIEKGEFGLIDNCTFINNYQGVVMMEAEHINITNNRFIGSHEDLDTGCGVGVFAGKAEWVNIVDNYFENYSMSVHITDSKNNLLDNNHFENFFYNMTADGVYFDNVNSSAITNNDFLGCDAKSQFSDVTISGLSTAGMGDQSITLNPNCHNIRVYGNRFYDMDGNLIADSSTIPAFDIPIMLGVVASIVIIGIMWRKRK